MSTTEPGDDRTSSMEYLTDEPGETSASRPRRRRGLAVALGVALLAAGGGGAFALATFLSSGSDPATAAPKDSLAFVSLDLDPSGAQKVAAYRTMRKFPALKENLRLTSEEDLREWAFDGLTSDSGCTAVTYDDVSPWLGDSLGVGATEADGEAMPFIVVEVTDQDAARTGVDRLASCLGGEETDVAFVDDFMIVAEKDGQAADVAAQVAQGALADDATYQERTGEAGDDGIVTAYVAPAAATYFREQVEAASDSTGGGADAPQPPVFDPFAALEDLDDQLAEQLKDFDGAALKVRFADESLEAEAAMAGLGDDVLGTSEIDLGDLPATTGAAVGFATGEQWADAVVDRMRSAAGDDVDSMMEQTSQQTGLDLPDDLAAIVGDSMSIVVDSSIDFEAIGGPDGPGDGGFAMAVRVDGNPDELTPPWGKVSDSFGRMLGIPVSVEAGSSAVGISPDPAYARTIAGSGGLRDTTAFGQALPDGGTGVAGLYVDFDAGDWLDSLLEGSSSEDRANVDPLSALGATMARDGDSLHGRLRLTTD